MLKKYIRNIENQKRNKELNNYKHLTPLKYKVHFNYIASYYFKPIKYYTSEKQSMRLEGKIPQLEFFTLSIVGKTILMDGLLDS